LKQGRTERCAGNFSLFPAHLCFPRKLDCHLWSCRRCGTGVISIRGPNGLAPVRASDRYRERAHGMAKNIVSNLRAFSTSKPDLSPHGSNESRRRRNASNRERIRTASASPG
jgi:hypothetical protein